MKNFSFYIVNIFSASLPKFIFQYKLNYWLKEAKKYPKEVIESRVNYYLNVEKTNISNNSIRLKNFTRPKKGTMYFFDLLKSTRYFNNAYKINFKFGDIQDNQESLTIVKSRPINHNGNSVIMKLDSLRHYHFVNDKIPFSEKKNMAVWRGYIHKENRRSLVEKFHNHSLCNIGQSNENLENPNWQKKYLSIKDQLKYKFIISIEGLDVATNLKWIMSSNSLCFMPTPKFETWYMEGKLIPNIHYVHIKDDYSDLEEKITYYSNNEKLSLKIIANAQDWVNQFKNKKLEKIISLKVLEKYFKVTNQQL